MSTTPTTTTKTRRNKTKKKCHTAVRSFFHSFGRSFIRSFCLFIRSFVRVLCGLFVCFWPRNKYHSTTLILLPVQGSINTTGVLPGMCATFCILYGGSAVQYSTSLFSRDVGYGMSSFSAMVGWRQRGLPPEGQRDSWDPYPRPMLR